MISSEPDTYEGGPGAVIFLCVEEHQLHSFKRNCYNFQVPEVPKALRVAQDEQCAGMHISYRHGC